KEAPISFAEILKKRSRSRSVYRKENKEQEGIRKRLNNLEGKIKNMKNKINILWKWWMAVQEEQKEAEQKNEEEEEQ
ncbi:12319_t:CDS:1, partial [Acaulospora morrowiae]